MLAINALRFQPHRLVAGCLVCAAVLLALFPQTTLAQSKLRLGTNLNEVNDYSPEVPFLDVFKMSRDWYTSAPGTFDTGEAARLDRDAQGWIRSLNPLPGSPVRFTRACSLIFSMGAVQGGNLVGRLPYPAGPYVVRYDGEGTLVYGLAARKNDAQSVQGRDVIDVTPQEPGIEICITATDPAQSGNHIRNIRVYQPGMESSAATEQFHPDFLARVQPYSVLRFMDWMRTNNSTQVEASQRPLPTDHTYATEKGVPAEVMADLANRLSAMPWFNMPHGATDGYVSAFATAVRDRLAPGRSMYVEYSNEIWNDQFSQGRAISDQGVAQFVGKPESDFDKRLNRFGERSAQICQIWRTVFGSGADRVRCVMGGQAANTYIAETALECPLSALKPCRTRGFHGLAIAPYIGDHVGLPSHQTAVEGWTGAADGGLTQLFSELNTGSVLNDAEGGMPVVRARISAHAALARSQGVALLAYEGGQHLVGVGSPANSNAINTLFDAANRDVRMGTLYSNYLDEWATIGGGLFMHFSDVGSYSRFGRWGALEMSSQTSSPKHDALMGAAATVNATRSNCLFDWAQLVLPSLFGQGSVPGILPPYQYRFYGTGNVLATSSADNKVWVLGPDTGQTLLDVGAMSDFLTLAGCE